VEGGGGGGGEAVNEEELFSPLLFSLGVVKNQRGVVSGGVSWRLLGHVSSFSCGIGLSLAVLSLLLLL
jgi:hypothetical protein